MGTNFDRKCSDPSKEGGALFKSPTFSLSPLKTTLATQKHEATLTVYVSTIPVKSASTILGRLRNAEIDNGLNLQHLRRFAKYTDVPEHVLSSIQAARRSLGLGPDVDTSQELLLLVGGINSVSHEEVHYIISPTVTQVPICSIMVPLLAPTSYEQAVSWSSRFWPTVYKKSNPFGPHPSIISRAQEDIDGDSRTWMELAIRAGQESRRLGHGEAIGVAVVERCDGQSRLLAVSGDARWLDWKHGGSGNVAGHAVLRSIAMVATSIKASENGNIDSTETACTAPRSIFHDKPVISAEHGQSRASTSRYLCHGLEIYCSHEPCVMCSMAILHSRFGKVIFNKRMPETGGLSSEGDLAHGLFWRKELNWTLLAWEMSNGDASGETLGLEINA
ncbi:hypothetical protein BP5796_04668 [Coleophoma crateriformis]|uniref:CMP/dCMP-type deaminase domain-containing protein n=1 Tax=Coleophoma crateriformis TaxID=565419 RepID=A0A3D8S9Z7_9HELO|nr:hypothetical protein BP5796_04668 [Coleophoma crateriformis]